MIILILFVILVIIFMIFVSKYNKFIRARNRVEESFSTMDVFMKKRYDLIPNMVEVVKGYATHESKTLEKIIDARNVAKNANGVQEKMESEQNFQTLIGSLYAIHEAYPQLKADKNFLVLMQQLDDVEIEISNARRFYNAIVNDYNSEIEVFPNNIIASLFQFTRKPLFEIQEKERQNVEVDLKN